MPDEFGNPTSQEFLEALVRIRPISGTSVSGKPEGVVQSSVGRLPRPSDIPSPPVQQPPQSYLSRALQGGQNLLSIITTPLIDIPDEWVGDNAVLKAIEGGVEGLTSPLGIGTALFAPVTGGASLGLTGLGGVAARTGTRLAAEAALGSLAGGASQLAKSAIPEEYGTAREIAGLGAGLVGGIAGAKGLKRIPGFEAAQPFKPFNVKVARDVELEPGGAKVGGIALQPTGSPVRGIPVSPDAADVPDLLYSVVPSASRAREQGRIYTSAITGTTRGSLGDNVINLFTKNDAEQLAADFKIINRSSKQTRDELVNSLEKQAKREGWAWSGDVHAKPVAGGLESYRASGGAAGMTKRIFEDYFSARNAAANVDTTLPVALKINPFEFESLDSIRRMPSDIASVAVSKQGLKPVTGEIGGMLTKDESGSIPNFNFYADVPFATRTQILAAEADPAIRGFVNALESARMFAEDPKNKQALEALRSSEAAKRTAIFTERVRNASTTQEALAARRALAGKFDALLMPGNLQLDPALYDDLMKIVQQRGFGYDIANAQTALNKLFGVGPFPSKEIPNASEIKVLEKIFGVDFASAVEPLRTPGLRENLLDVLNIPRALVSSGDISYTLRQGLLLSAVDPILGAKTLVNAARAFASPKFADEVTNLALGVAGTERQKLVSTALREWGMDVVSGPTSAEELFRTGLWGQKVFKSNEAGNLLRASDRSFSTSGNFQRWEMGQKVVNNWIESLAKSRGLNLDDTGVYESLLKEIPNDVGEKIANAMNVLTGRAAGDWKRLTTGDLGQVLNAGFFSPSFFLSRVQGPVNLITGAVDAAKRDPRLLLTNAGRQELYRSDPTLGLYAKAFGNLAATGMGMYFLLPALGVDFTIDPRSTDFGKIKYGETRIDPWGGYAPLARQLAQFVTGERISSRGQQVDASRLEVVQNFLRSKLSPTAGFGWNVVTGQNFNNREVSLERNSLESQVASSLVPLFLQDMKNGFDNGDIGSAALASLSALGLGVQAYKSVPQMRDEAAYRISGGKTKLYSDLSAAEKAVVESDPKLIQAIAEYESSVPANSYSGAIQEILAKRDASLNFEASQLANKYINRKQFSDRVGVILKATSDKRGQALKDFGIPDNSAPNSPLDAALKEWRQLYTLADEGYNQGFISQNIDWEKFEQLERDLKAKLSPEQWQHVQERTRYEGNDATEWWFANRQYINESTDYYSATDRYFEKYRSRVEAINPAIKSYSNLLAYTDAVRLTNPSEYNRLNNILKSIRRPLAQERENMRRKDPKLDAALYTLGRTNKLLTPKAKSAVGDWLDSESGKPDPE